MANEKISSQKITPFLWFDANAEEAVNFYVSVFKDASIDDTSYYGDGMPLPKGTVLTVGFTLFGQKFIAMNGGPNHPFTDAVSFVVNCKDQQEVDYYWSKLTDGGAEVACGWLKDKFGLSWQIVPVRMMELLLDKDEAKHNRAMQAMMQMVKLDIATLEKAAAGN